MVDFRVHTGNGTQAQQPLARVVVGAMITALLAILFLMPVLASFGGPPSPAAGTNE